MRDILKVYGPAILLIVVLFAVAIRFVAPPPPKVLRLAAGATDGYYQSIGKRYEAVMEPEGLDDVIVIDTEGSIDNLHLLSEHPEKVDVALVQGGLASEVDSKNLVAIAGVFYEPVWVLVRNGVRAARLSDLKGRRIAIGPEGSGTRVLATQLLAANDIDGDSATLASLGTGHALKALDDGEIDAAFFVASEPSHAMTDLLTRKRARILPFDQAEAYRMKFGFLTPVQLPKGAVSLAANVPPVDITLLAPTGMLVAREDIHPALVNLLLRAAREIESGRQLFAAAGTFPMGKNLDFPLHPDAQRYFDRGPSLVYRYLPFWIAVWIERATILAIPLLTMVPIIRLAPPAYRWQVQRKIYRWYTRLRHIENRADTAKTAEERRTLLHELDGIEPYLLRLKVPISYAQQLYDLRQHVDFVRARLQGADNAQQQAAQ
ncbi:MAG TPA: TAXI family TRAP transporter solute-binding subunit [Alphaproteobacteria bacterium]